MSGQPALTVGIIGAGQMAQVAHIPAWLRLRPDVEIGVLCDEDKVRLKGVAQKYSIPRVVTDFEDVLRDDSITAVDICTPNHLHSPIAVAAFRAGKHVLCERPMARNSREAESMVKAAEKAGRILMCAMNNRFNDEVELLRTFIKKRELGELFHLKCGWLRRGVGYGWKAVAAKSGGGAVLELGVQMLDLALWLAGERKVATVSAQVHRPRPDAVEDSAAALLRFADGGFITLEVSWSLNIESDLSYLQVFGTRGAASLSPLRIHKEMHGNLVNVTPAFQTPRNRYRTSYDREIQHFVGCISGREGELSPGQDGLEIMRLIDAIYTSAKNGREVALA